MARRLATLHARPIALGVLVFGILSPASALEGKTSSFTPSQRRLIRTCLHDINIESYDEAFACAARLRAKLPDSAAGSLVEAAAHQMRMSDYRVRRYESDFETAIQNAVEVARQASASSPTPENLLLLGTAESYRAFHLFRQGHWLKAIGAARRGNAHLRRARQADPSFADPLIGIALYEYGKSKVSLLGISPFGSALEDVLAQLREAERSSRFLAVNARYALLYVLVDSGMYREALGVSDKLYADFPSNPVCLYNRALILQNLGREREAMRLWQRVLDTIGSFPPASQGFAAECLFNMATIAHREGHERESGRLLERSWRHARSRRHAEELNGPYQTFFDLRDEIEEARSSWGTPSYSLLSSPHPSSHRAE